MEQLARVQDIRNVFQKILCVPERWKGTERRGFARDNNLQAFFVLPHTLFVSQAIKRSAVVLALSLRPGIRWGKWYFGFMSKTRFVPFSHFTTFWNMIWLYDMSFA